MKNWIGETNEFVKSSLSRWLTIIGLGHPLRSDDYVGSLIVKDLNKIGPINARVKLLDLENSAEAMPSSIVHSGSSDLMVVDAVEMRLPPGSIRLVEVTDTTYPFFATHNLPVKLILSETIGASQAKLLGIQPLNVAFGTQLSDVVQSARHKIVQHLGSLITTGGY